MLRLVVDVSDENTPDVEGLLLEIVETLAGATPVVAFNANSTVGDDFNRESVFALVE